MRAADLLLFGECFEAGHCFVARGQHDREGSLPSASCSSFDFMGALRMIEMERSKLRLRFMAMTAKGKMSAMDTQKHLYDIIKDFRTAMLVTRSGDGIHARPMHVAELKPDADAYFVAKIESPKVTEIESDPRVLITFQSGSEFATIEGTASVVRDRALIDRMWSEAWKVWFPKGKDDPSICLLKVAATHGEYWDNSGLEGFKYLFEGVKAIFKGRTPEVDKSQHAKVRL